MKTLLLLRHAKSSWRQESLVDHERPLNKRGKRDAKKIGRLLVTKGLLPDLILSSTAKRARRTAEALMAASGRPYPQYLLPELYNAQPGEIVQTLRDYAAAHDVVLVVAHNPAMAEWLADLDKRQKKYPTGALAVVEYEIDDWNALGHYGDGILRSFFKPRSVKLKELEPKRDDG